MKELEKEIETLKAASSNGDELQKNIDLQLYAKQSNSADQVWVGNARNRFFSLLIENHNYRVPTPTPTPTPAYVLHK